MDIKDYTSIIISLTALITSIVTLYKLKSEKKSRKADAYIRFQDSFRKIQEGFPPEINDTDEEKNYNWTPKTPTEKRNISIYWQLVFDEWYFCNQGEKYLTELWEKIYSEGIRGALKRKPFREVLVENFKSKSYMLGYKKEFKDEINRIYYKDNGINLVD